jgi:FMN-dependent NADH-azoreductase
MPVLLHLDSSADLTSSRSRAITATFAEAWRGLGDDHTVVYRDLHRDALPYLSDASLHFPAHLRPVDASPNPAQEALQEAVVAELLGADVLVIGVPLYNYSMPATLKTWVDYIHIPGVTASFGPAESQPLKGRSAVLISTRGGAYDAGTPTEFHDHAIPALSLILKDALGMTVQTIVATRTLSERFGAPEEEVVRQHAELAAAHASAALSARRLG